MADKSFGVRKLDLTGAAGTPTIESPNNLNLNAINVAISTDISIGGEVKSDLIINSLYSVGVGTTNPTSSLHVIGNGNFSGIVTALRFSGTASTASFATTAFNLSGTASTASFATTAFNLTNAANILTGTISAARLTGEYNIDITGKSYESSYSDYLRDAANIVTGTINADRLTGSYNINITGSATTSTNVIGGISSVTSLSVSGISTLGTVRISSGIITASSGTVTYYGDGSNLTGVVATGVGITVAKNGSIIGIGSIINFQDHFDVSAVSGYATVTVDRDAVNYFKTNAVGIHTTSSVGIGTTNPLGIFHVVGTSSTQFLLVNSSGGVGIGTTNIQGQFAVRDNSGTSGFSQIIRAEKRGTSDVNVFRIDIDADTDEVRLIGTGNQSTNINILSGDTTCAYFTRTGNAGIGTTNPEEKLQVDGNIRVGISTTSNYIAFRGTFGDGVNANGGDQNLIGLRRYSHTFIGERIYDYSGVGERSELLLFKGNDSSFDAIGLSTVGPDRIRLFSGEHRFDVIGLGNTYGTFEQVGLSTLAVNVATINPIGVGIATTSPTSKLHVVGDSLITGISTIANVTITPIGFGATVGSSSTVGIITYYGDGQHLKNINAGVSSAAGSDGQIQYNNGGTVIGGASEFYYDDVNNRVGIGTSVPTQTLHVQGNVFISGILTSTQSTVGSAETANKLALISTPVDNLTYPLFAADATGNQSVFADTDITWDATNNRLVSPIIRASTRFELQDSKTITFGDGNDVNVSYAGTENVLNIRMESTVNYISFNDGTTERTKLFRSGGADFTTGIVTATDFNSASDERLKTNIQTIADPLEKVLQIRGVNFEWKENHRKSSGVIAQEIECIFPELVIDGEIKTVNYNGLIGVLIESIKELKSEIEELKEKINN